MKTVISRRTIARLVSFSLAIIAVLGAADLIYMRKLSRAENFIEYGYRQAVEDLASSADKISSTLTKGLYSGSPAMMTRLSNELLSEASTAKNALTKLPVYNTSLERTEKFLTQIGNYASSISAAASRGEETSYEDYSRLSALCQNAKELSKQLWEMQSRFLSDDKTITQLFADIDSGEQSFITDGFAKLEDGFSSTPKLIYDGPFSDHILERTPRLIQGASQVNEDEARRRAAQYCGMEDWQLKTVEGGEQGKMPSYCFRADGIYCAVTQNGGYISYLIKSREPRTSKITPAEAEVYARSYLDSLAISGMKKTYYETYNNVCTINYAYEDNGVTCYTDLIKISVAMDNGEILGFDARGFIVNHHERNLGEPVLSEQECQEKLSPMLSVVKSALAVIPTNSVDEKLCWEFKCKTSNDDTVLVYINSKTGDEEDILILLETDESQLTV